MQAYLRRLAQRLASFVVVERPRKAKIRPLEPASIPLRTRIVDDLGDLHELDGWRDAIQAGHSLAQLLGEEPLRRLFGVPDVEVDRPLLLLIEGKNLNRRPGMPSNIPRAFSATLVTRERSKSPV